MKIDNFNFTKFSQFQFRNQRYMCGPGAFNGFNPEREVKIAQKTNFVSAPLEPVGRKCH